MLPHADKPWQWQRVDRCKLMTSCSCCVCMTSCSCCVCIGPLAARCQRVPHSALLCCCLLLILQCKAYTFDGSCYFLKGSTFPRVRMPGITSHISADEESDELVTASQKNGTEWGQDEDAPSAEPDFVNRSAPSPNIPDGSDGP